MASSTGYSPMMQQQQQQQLKQPPMPTGMCQMELAGPPPPPEGVIGFVDNAHGDDEGEDHGAGPVQAMGPDDAVRVHPGEEEGEGHGGGHHHQNNALTPRRGSDPDPDVKKENSQLSQEAY